LITSVILKRLNGATSSQDLLATCMSGFCPAV